MIADLPMRFPRATLLVAAVLTIGLGLFAARFSVDSAVDQLLPEDDADGVYYEGVRRAFGSEEIAVVGIFADDVFAPATLARIDRLSAALAALPGVAGRHQPDHPAAGRDGRATASAARRSCRRCRSTRRSVAALRARALADRLGRALLVVRRRPRRPASGCASSR